MEKNIFKNHEINRINLLVEYYEKNGGCVEMVRA